MRAFAWKNGCRQHEEEHPVDGLPFVNETVGCSPDSIAPQQMPRVAWLPLRPMQCLGQQAPVRQPERDADNDRKPRHRVPAGEPREGRPPSTRLPARRRRRSSHGVTRWAWGEKHVADAGSRDADSCSGRHALHRVEKHQRLDGLGKRASGARESADRRGRPQPSETVGKSTVKQIPYCKANRQIESVRCILRLSHRWRSRYRQMLEGRY